MNHMNHMNQVRPTAVAGVFYPDNAQEIEAVFSTWMLSETMGSVPKIPRALIVPHAGYLYSGAVAAKAYAHWKGAEGTIKTVVVIGPAHRVPFEGIVTISSDQVATPLGNIDIDADLREQLLTDCPQQVGVLDIAHAPEHSIEVHFPFIKKLLPHTKVLPLLNGRVTAQDVTRVMKALWQYPDVYFVISSDLSHFHPYFEAQQIDGRTAEAIRQGNWQVLNGEMACGYRGIQGLLGMMPDYPMVVKELEVVNSGDTAGSKDRVVGYGAWTVYEIE